jgi:uncharacterized phage protein (TIGR01671 family)
MREIKFRVWDNDIKKMIYSFNYENIMGKQWAGNGAIQHEVDGEVIVIMQYTGLKDKNGKEIYEGDLFNCIYKSDGCNHKWQVVYYEEYTSFRLKRIGKICQQLAVDQKVSDVARYEVIGNIYENSELLNN